MSYHLYIEADTNDGDYTSSMHEVTEEQVRQLEPVFAAIRAFKPYRYEDKAVGIGFDHTYNWPSGEFYPREDLGEKFPVDIYKGVLTPEQVELFEEFCPRGESGIHSIVEIRVIETTHIKVYLER